MTFSLEIYANSIISKFGNTEKERKLPLYNFVSFERWPELAEAFHPGPGESFKTKRHYDISNSESVSFR
jgi:hypothetical protein